MNIYGFLGAISKGKVVTIVLSNMMVSEYNARTSLSTYIGDNDNYYYIYSDEESKTSEVYNDIKNILRSREEKNVHEFLTDKK